MVAQPFDNLNALFKRFKPEWNGPKRRYQALTQAMAAELSMPIEYSLVACDDLVGSRSRAESGIPPVVIYLEERGLESLNRLDIGVRQARRFSATRTEVQKRPIRVVGVSVPMTTGERGRAPKPLAQLELLHTDLDRGHVMALEIGGPDEKENIVPQWSQWQQSGSWRYHETQVRRFGELVLQRDSGTAALERVSQLDSALVVVDINLDYPSTTTNTRWSTPKAAHWETLVFHPKDGGYEVILCHEVSRDFAAEVGDELAYQAFASYRKHLD